MHGDPVTRSRCHTFYLRSVGVVRSVVVGRVRSCVQVGVTGVVHHVTSISDLSQIWWVWSMSEINE